MLKTRSIESKMALLMLSVILSSITHTATAQEKKRHRHERFKRQATIPPPPWDANLVLGAVNELRDVNIVNNTIVNNTDILPWITSRTPTNTSTSNVSSQFKDSIKTNFLLSMLPSNFANRGKASPMGHMTAEPLSTLIKTSTKTPVVLEFDPLVKVFGGKGQTFSPDTGDMKSDIVTNNAPGNRHESITLNENEQDPFNMGFTVDVNSPDWLTDDSVILGVFDLGIDIETPIIDFTGTIDVSNTDDVTTSAVDTLQLDDVTNTVDITNKVTNTTDQHVQNADSKSAIITTTILKPVIQAKCNQQCLSKQRANITKRIQQLNLKVRNLVCLRNGQKQGCWKNQTVNNHENISQTSSQPRVQEKKQIIFDTRIKTFEKQRHSLQTRLHVINNAIEDLKTTKNSAQPAGKQHPSKVALNRNPKRRNRQTK